MRKCGLPLILLARPIIIIIGSDPAAGAKITSVCPTIREQSSQYVSKKLVRRRNRRSNTNPGGNDLRTQQKSSTRRRVQPGGGFATRRSAIMAALLWARKSRVRRLPIAWTRGRKLPLFWAAVFVPSGGGRRRRPFPCTDWRMRRGGQFSRIGSSWKPGRKAAARRYPWMI